MMKILLKMLVVILAVGLLVTSMEASSNENDEYSYSKFTTGGSSTNNYFSQNNAPYVYTSTRCSKGKNPICWPIIITNTGKELANYGSKDSVGTVASGRYKDIAYLYYSHSYKRGKEYYTDYYFTDQTGKKYNTPDVANGSLSRNITKDAKVLDVTSNGIYLNNKLILDSTFKLTHAKIQNNLKGLQSIVAVTNTNAIVVSNTKKWITSKISLTTHGDRMGILSVYPKNNSVVVYSIYKYVNSYNKGLILGRVNFDNNENISGWLFNSEKRNVGFDPSIYVKHNDIIISAKNSSNNSYVKTVVKDDSKLKHIVGVKPKNIEGFENEKTIAFLAGTSLSQIQWVASNKVEDENSNSQGEVTYDISKSIYKSVYFQGKYNDTQLAISHLKNEAEAKGGVQKKASQFTSMVLDIDGFFSPQSSLRIVSEKGEVNGLATWLDANGDAQKDIDGNDVKDIEISTDMNRLSFFIMKERGYYHGLDYTSYVMPSLLGFGKDGSVKFTVFDPKSKIEKLTYNIGYDELSYAKRYENNFSRLYFQGLFGLGLGKITMSDDGAYAKQKAKEEGYDGIGSDMTIAVDYLLDFGYIIQKKAKFLRGAGYSTQIGYKLRGTYFRSGSSSKKSSDDSSSESNDLTLEFERNDYWHGAYISFNLIF